MSTYVDPAAITAFDFNADTFDSRDVEARIAHLISEWEDATGEAFSDYTLSTDDILVGLGDEDEAEELHDLLEIRSESGSFEDWHYGTLFISEAYFTTYAEQLADDLGAINSNASWPLTHIDWEAAAEDLKQDYTSIEIKGLTYWGR